MKVLLSVSSAFCSIRVVMITGTLPPLWDTNQKPMKAISAVLEEMSEGGVF